MPKNNKRQKKKIVTWLSEEIDSVDKKPINFRYYTKFQFNNLIAEVGDYVLVSNADSAEPDTEAGCDAARILALYEDTTNTSSPYRAKVQWYSSSQDVPIPNAREAIAFLDREVIEDHRPFDVDVSIETFFKKCSITFAYTKDTDLNVTGPYSYICRFRLIPVTKRTYKMEPLLKEECKAIEVLSTPAKTPSLKTPNPPSSLVKQMNTVSISEKTLCSVSKNNRTKLLLKKAILADIEEKDLPKKATPKKAATPKSSQKISKNNIEEVLLMELQENSDDELPTPSQRSIKPLVSPEQSLAGSSTEPGFRVKQAPRKSIRKLAEDSDIKFRPVPKTPKTHQTPRTPQTTPVRTPKRKRINELIPRLRSRAHSVNNADEFLNENRSLPGREQHLSDILNFVRTKLLEGTSGCMYISGVPGTGKTATVCTALKILKEETDLPDFQLVEVNGKKIAEPRQAYVQIYKQLTGKSVVWEQACSLLDKRFTNPEPRRIPTVLLVDELDALLTRRQDVLYCITEWARHNSALLTVLAVANAMDLPERTLAARVSSRLGLSRLTFLPYTHSQLQAIVATRLATERVTADALELIARKVASVSGDARRALSLCARTLELAKGGPAGLAQVQEALEEASSGSWVRAIQACAPAQRLMLRAVATEVERTGFDETTLSRALVTADAIVALQGRPYRSATQIRAPTHSQALALCSSLAAHGLLLMERQPGDTKLMLNVSVDDVHYALIGITP